MGASARSMLVARVDWQVRELGGRLDDVARGVGAVERDTAVLPAMQRDLAEMNQETVALLRDIRDRLPGH